MSFKMKLTSTICAFLLILGLTIMGVFAAPSATVNLGGSLTFSANNVYARVTGKVEGYGNATEPQLGELLFKAEQTPEEETAFETVEEQWKNCELEFKSEGSPITITITIENLAKDRVLYASVNSIYDIVNVESGMTQLVSTTNDAEGEYTGAVLALPASTADGSSVAKIAITLEVDNKNVSLEEGAKWGYNVILVNESEVDNVNNISNLSFEVLDETAKTVYVYKKSNEGTTGDIVIPSYVKINKDTGEASTLTAGMSTISSNVYKVTQIGDNFNPGSQKVGFYGTSITSVDIPDTVTKIGSFAFFGLKTLKEVNLGNSVIDISLSAFYNCSELTNITLPKSVSSIGSAAFYGCSKLKEFFIPDGVTNLSTTMFQNCTSLTSVTIPASVTSIGGSAFEGCTSLTTITIPSSVTSISDNAFSGCSELTDVIIGKYPTTQGIGIFSNCPKLQNITVNSGIIGNSTGQGSILAGNTSIKNLRLGNGVTSMLPSAFRNCKNLISITISESVTEIGMAAFFGCENLTIVNYRGTKEQWDAINIEVGNEDLTSVENFNYNYTE